MSGIMDTMMQARFDAYDDMMRRGCTCQPGRDHDGSDFGPCGYCEALTARARADLTAYTAAMLRLGGEDACLAIERRWGLDGLPPAMVSEALADLGNDPRGEKTGRGPVVNSRCRSRPRDHS